MERIDKIRIECQTTFGVRLDSRCRQRKFAEARAAFAVVARRFGYKLREIGAITGRDCNTVANSIRSHQYMSQALHNITDRIYEAVLINDKAVNLMANRMKQMDFLTDNEKAYRKLTAAQRKVYDERVSAILKMI